MPRRKQLKSIAAGIADSFNSRNNAIEGYWAIGKLCRFAHEHTISLLTLDLLNIICTPQSAEFNAVMHDYKVKLRAIMNKQGIPEDQLKAATIEIDFHPEYKAHLHCFRSVLGSPYTVTTKLMTDLGKIYCVRTGGNCKPHDPLMESRRSV
ncbi:hypothetical protein ACO0LG_26830 [Undibacterium sp. Ji42W]|uniref:hypothetical protein n=1 Tax=Undibacterium sp. Ji42W TaxID=3413039 RepID=UPI003BF14063